MKILICTQIVDMKDPNLGFAHGWVKEFARNAEHVHVICLREGEHDLPKHVQVHTLGKESGGSRLKYLIRFYHTIWKFRKEYDAVFVHMNPEYVALGGLFWRLWGKRVGLWYTHRSVTRALRIATVLMHHGFTGSVESYQIQSPKVIVTGQGVDTSIFVPTSNGKREVPTLLLVGRISPIKNLELAIETLALVKEQMPVRLRIVGAPAKPEDAEYEKRMRELVVGRGLQEDITFVGGKDGSGVLEELQNADVFLHTSNTQSADKTVVEAMACGIPVVSSSPVYAKDLPPESIQPSTPEAYSSVILQLLARTPEERTIAGALLRETAIREHSLARLIRWIASVLRGV